jgi:hypothetical protein
LSGVVVFGGYGTFGAHVCRELARLGSRVTVAGPRIERAEALVRSLGAPHRAVAADVADSASCRAALAGHSVAVHCAGAFSACSPALLDTCLEAGCHYADIADDRAYAALVRGYGDRFGERRLTAAYGCSSLPAISGALALLARGASREPVDRARVTLFIGNDNPKGAAAIRSAVAGLGRAIPAPQGALRGFGHGEVVALPAPFGRRRVYDFESPDYDLLPELVDARAISVKVGFESRLATAAFALLAGCGSRYGARTSRLFEALGRLAIGGSSGGTVLSELIVTGQETRRAALHAARDGQRMAALPAALAARALEDGSVVARGACTAYQLLGGEALVARMQDAGFTLLRG